MYLINSISKKTFIKTFFTIFLFIINENFLPATDQTIPLTLKNVKGNWSLMYGNNYGYDFKLNNNYKAVVILYLSTSSIIFRGIYNVENSDTLRINISEMKREDKIKNTHNSFIKTKSSYFIFKAKILNKKRKILQLHPADINIDGNNSEGYFEPVIELVSK